ncbi:LysR family transcriptional regulator [Pseudomonas fluorescens]|uniref:LysR family transcriptional regulator n=1 Tax=Pseudomonas fluorescens TaxID=294 RepID=UPI003F995A9C
MNIIDSPRQENGASAEAQMTNGHVKLQKKAGTSMDLKRLELLIHVADFGSFSKSAAVLGIAQPALGRQIQKLEEECGVKLLYRHGRGVSLTSEGQLLVSRATPLVRQLEAIAGDLQSAHEDPQGTVVVGLTPTVCDLLGVRLLKSVAEKYPKLTVNIVSGYSGYIHEWLVDGRLDIAVLHDARRSATVAVEPIGIARLSLITPPGLLSQSPTPGSISISGFADIPLALSSRNHGLRRTLELAANAAGIELNVVYEVDTLALALELVVEGLASTVLARPAYAAALQAGKISEVLIKNPFIETRLMVAEASNRPVTRGMRLVKHEIMTIMENLTRTAGEEHGLISLP